jgi:hypothetical protein
VSLHIGVVNGKEVLQCPHCNGTTVCQHTAYLTSTDAEGDWIEWKECSTCGKGIKSNIGGGSAPPPCATCEGKGFIPV